jgi:hypothetical protein
VKNGTIWRQGRLFDYLLLTVVVLAFAANWLNFELPNSPRQEGVTTLTWNWYFYHDLAQGHPLREWNRFEFCGYPAIRYLSFPWYYLVALPSVLLPIPLEISWKFFYILTYAISAWGMYEFIRYLTGRRSAGLVAGVIYATFPFHIIAGLESSVHVGIWALNPWFLLLAEHAARRPKEAVRWGVVLGVVLCLYAFIDTEHTIVSSSALAAYALLTALLARRRGVATWRGLATLAVVGAIVALGLSAIVVLPSIMEIKWVGLANKHASAQGVDVTYLDIYAVKPALMWEVIVRRLNGTLNPMDRTLKSIFPNFNWYLGVVTLALAFLSLGGVRKRPQTLFLLLGLLFGLAWVGGPAGPLPIFRYVPIMKNFMPHRGMMVVGLGLAALAGLGYAWLLERLPDRFPRVALTGLVMALVLLDHAPAAGAFISQPDYFYPDERQAYRWLAAQPGEFRIWEPTHFMDEDAYIYTYAVKDYPLLRFDGYYDNGAPRHMRTFFRHALGVRIFSDFFETPLDLAAVRYILFHTREPIYREVLPELKARDDLAVVWETEHVTIFENKKWRPFFRLYRQAALDAALPQEGVLAALPLLAARDVALVDGPSPNLEDYDPAELRRYALILQENPAARFADRERPVADPLAGELQAVLEPIPLLPASDELAWEQLGDERAELTIRLDEPALLVRSESWYPNWRVLVDGQEAPLLRVNFAFQGVYLEPGEHQVTFEYRYPWYVWVGAALSGLTLLAIAAWAVVISGENIKEMQYFARHLYGQR